MCTLLVLVYSSCEVPILRRWAVATSKTAAKMHLYGLARLAILSQALPDPHAYAVGCCLAWGGLVGFHALHILHPGVSWTLAHACNLTPSCFRTLAFLVHGLPCIVSLLFLPKDTSWRHGILANVLLLSWATLHSRATFCLSRVYPLPLSRSAWILLYGIVAVSTFIVAIK